MAITPSRRTFLQVAAAGTAVAAIPVGVRELATPPAAAAAETPGADKVVTSVCEMCTVRCPILVRVRDGKVIRIEGNPKEKSTQGAICARGNAGISLREDPDLRRVGGLRDRETAGIAGRAALTGHLVLSTLHTTDAPTAVTRALDLGVPPYLINSTVLGVLAQRLVRTLCPHCKAPVDPPDDDT